MTAITASPTLIHGAKSMAQSPRQSAVWYQKQLLDKISEVDKKVDKSLDQNSENGKQIELIKLALGLDGAHGRLPQLEQAIARLDRQQEDDNKNVICRMDKLESCIDNLTAGEHEARGRKQFWTIVRGFVGGSAGAAVVGVLAKMLGLIH